MKYKHTKEQKIVVFNFKILNNILAVPLNLFRWKIYDNPLCHMCFSIGSVEHTILECSYFTMYYKIVKDIFTFMNLENINFNISTLICGYKYEDTDYLYVNQLLCIIYFTVYKINVQFRNGKRYEPLEILKSELSCRLNTKTYSQNQIMKKFLFHLYNV